MMTITQPQTPLQQREALVNMVNSRWEYSEKYFHAIRTRLPQLYNVWRGIYTGRFHPHKNNIHIPLIYSAIWADAARKSATSFGTYPVVQMQGYGPDDEPIAKKHEQLVSAQMKDADAFMKEVNTYVTADLYGTAITQVMWDHRVENMTYDDYSAMPMSGERIRQIRKAKVCTFDGPNWENVDRLDAAPQPGPRIIKGMGWFGRRYFLDLDDVRLLAAPIDGRRPIFDPAEAARLEREGYGAAKAVDDAKERRYMSRLGMSDEDAKYMDPYSRPIEVRELWGVVPSELGVDGETNLVITVLNRQYLARARGNPFWHRQKPFLAFSPTPDPHYFDAPGKAEIAEKMNLVANRYLNQRLDAADLFIDPAFFYDRNAGLNTRNLYLRPGRFIGLDGSPAERVMPIQPDLRGLQLGANLTAEMMGYVERGTGIQDDTVQGIDASGSDRQTAREFVGRREASGTRLMLESRLYEETYLEPLANLMMRLNRQFLEGEVEYMILGDNSVKDPVTGKPITETHGVIEGRELTHTYTARAYGATTALSKSARQSNVLGILQAISANPAAVGAVNMVNFFRQIFIDFDFHNVNDLLNQQPALRDAMSAAGVQGDPSSVPDYAQGTGTIAMNLQDIAGQGRVVAG